ncbi:MAG: CDP-diacylglycerol--serine O-phosphatidyltransferase, partial [Planctomycetaceae bacterium]|nr:CDP-diacylglycerol--serine O-phosphatidyltransferase [Planctomycetaceae bacterium]
IRTIAVFPTLLTLGNLICGFFAIVVASRIDKPEAIAGIDPLDIRNAMTSGCLIFLAMVFDGLDGYVARLARTTTDFGAQLDSLCDVVSFGVAPAFLLVKMCPRFTYFYDQAIWVIAAAFAACAALRLARFNVETSEDDDHLYFSGLPSPAAAAMVAGFAIMFYTLRQNVTPLKENVDIALQAVLPYFALLTALLMVSRIRYPHITNRVLRGHRSFGHVVAVLFCFVAIMVVRGYAVPMAACAFVLYGPVYWAWKKWVDRRPPEEPLF